MRLKLLNILPLLTIFICSKNLSGQPKSILKTWVGDDLEYLKIDSQKVYFEVFGNYPEEHRYIIKNDTLRLYSKYTTSTDRFLKVHVRTYDFRITKSSDSLLQLMPVNANALAISNNKTLLNYTERSSIQDTHFRFKEIRFRSTSCHGNCPDMTIQITSDQDLKFIGREHAIKKGFFTAKVPDSLYTRLREILSLSDLKHLKAWSQVVYDAPEYTLEIAYDDQIKCLRTYFLPAVCHELVLYLQTIAGQVELEKHDDVFELPFQSNCGKYPNPVYAGKILKNE